MPLSVRTLSTRESGSGLVIGLAEIDDLDFGRGRSARRWRISRFGLVWLWRCLICRGCKAARCDGNKQREPEQKFDAKTGGACRRSSIREQGRIHKRDAQPIDQYGGGEAYPNAFRQRCQCFAGRVASRAGVSGRLRLAHSSRSENPQGVKGWVEVMAGLSRCPLGGKRRRATGWQFGDHKFTLGAYFLNQRHDDEKPSSFSRVMIRPATRVAGIGNDSLKSRIRILAALARHHWRQRQKPGSVRRQADGEYPQWRLLRRDLSRQRQEENNSGSGVLRHDRRITASS